MVCHVTVTSAEEPPEDKWEAVALRAAIEASGLTQQALADLAGMDRSVVNGLARGRRPMTRANAARLAEHLSVKPEDLLPPEAAESPTEQSPLALLRQLAKTVEAQQGTIDELQTRIENIERDGKKPERAPRAGR